jgi:hypothetical protein
MWLRVSDPSSSVAAAAVTYRASTFDSGALYVAFDEWRSHPVLLGALQQSGFSFYTHTNVSKVGGGGEIVYYKWWENLFANLTVSVTHHQVPRLP